MAVVTGSRMILRCGHRVTAKFRRSQIVTPVAAVNMAIMGVTAPWKYVHTLQFFVWATTNTTYSLELPHLAYNSAASVISLIDSECLQILYLSV